MTKELQFAIDFADRADRIAMRFWRSPMKIKTKSSWRDLVTEADLQIDREFRKQIKRAFPHHGIISEEQKLDPRVWEKEFVWVIDPIDGTSNFTMGSPLFGTSIGLLRNGKPFVGVLTFPALQERYWAERGKSAWMQNIKGKKVPCRVSNITTLRDSRFSFGYGNTPDEQKVYFHYMPRLLRVARAGRDHHSAIFDLATVARGGMDFYICIGLYLWDVAASWIILTEAGGTLNDFEGQPFHRGARSIIATNGKIDRTLLRFLKK